MTKPNLFHFFCFSLLILSLSTACTDKESELGLNLVDPATIYNGKTETLLANTAYSLRDDSLRTSGYSFCIIGNRYDTLYGYASSELYTRIGLASGTNSIDFSNVNIDSVVLTLVIDELYPNPTASYNFHFEVMQLAEIVDTIDYYSTDTLKVNETKLFFDQTVTVGVQDSVVSLKLDPSIYDILKQSGSNTDFSNATKGLRIRIVDDADRGMVTLNLAALRTCMTAYYHYPYGDDTTLMSYRFLVGTGVQHFTHFYHNYTGTIFADADSVDGTDRLFLEPLAGHNVKLNFNNQLQAFRAAHPLAVIHHAELLMPVIAASSTEDYPSQIIVSRCTDSNEVYIPDQVDAYTYHGYDGTYDADRGLYRVRITQHIQDLLREGGDPGTLLMLDARRSSARQVVLAGRNASDPIKIVIVYSE